MFKKLLAAVLAIPLLMTGSAMAAQSEKQVILKYYGHSMFQLIHGNTSIVFDPYFAPGNTHNSANIKDVKCNYVFVSHGHFDHYDDALPLAKQNNATFVSTMEIALQAQKNGCQKIEYAYPGGMLNLDFGYVRYTPALHAAGIPGGVPCGFIVNFYGTKVYFAGDTGLFSDIELLSKLEDIDYAMLPIGDSCTMGWKDAVLAAEMIKAKHVIPMHYNTWGPAKPDGELLKNAVEQNTNTKVLVLKPGEAIELK